MGLTNILGAAAVGLAALSNPEDNGGPKEVPFGACAFDVLSSAPASLTVNRPDPAISAAFFDDKAAGINQISATQTGPTQVRVEYPAGGKEEAKKLGPQLLGCIPGIK